MVEKGIIRNPNKTYSKPVTATTIHNWEHGLTTPGVDVLDALCYMAAHADFRVPFYVYDHIKIPDDRDYDAIKKSLEDQANC